MGFNFVLFEFISVNAIRTLAPRRRGRHIVRGDFFTKVTARAFCRGSFPNRNHFRWVAVWLLKSTQESFLSTLHSSSQVVIYRLRRTFLFSCKAHRALILLLLASKPNPLRWAPVWFPFGDAASPVSKLAPRRSKARFAPAFAWQCFRIFWGGPSASTGREKTYPSALLF